MTDGFNDFFSPERLRKKWAAGRTAPQGHEKKQALPGSHDYEFIYETIYKLTLTGAKGPERILLSGLMDELKTQLDERFKPFDGRDGKDIDLSQINAAIDQTLIQLEDLLEALNGGDLVS